MSSAEVLVLGGGPAGAAAATLLARAGRRVILAEQHAGARHKVCGEFLSAEALHYLGRLDLDARSLGAREIRGLRLCSGRTAVSVPLPFPALSLTRARLDEALLALALDAGVELRRGQRAEALEYAEGCWQARLADGSALRAPQVFHATGKHDLRGRPRPPGRQNNLLALKQYFALLPEQAAALAGGVELHLFPGGYTGLQPVEPDGESTEGRVNLCALIERERYARMGSTWAALLEHMGRDSPLLAERLRGARPLLPRPLALSSIPYGHLRLYPEAGEPGLWRLGDQTAVIPSFSGDGMSIALHSAFLAGELYLSGRKPLELSVRLHGELRRGVGVATTISQALVRPRLQPLLRTVARLTPALLPRFARLTRIPSRALLH